MCAILDTNCYGEYGKLKNADFAPVRKWLNKGGKLVYAPTKEFEKSSRNIREWFKVLDNSGKAKMISVKELEVKKKDLLKKQKKNPLKLKSNDEDIIALAMITNVKVLISEDKNLLIDFKNKNIIGGSIYKNKTHEHLLKEDLCP